ncbi:GNAT family N-acetyltransferase [Rehaibacterium terrae]|uniref:Ribosomal protein S18 acetylase RimI-like enzyme n=1 Tax=Rehaibacterium terrae TaxID=1341696 RepID=A0A7W7XZJ3_9GAMM|nr:GNAT family N-acetyltransferase [Rehaibacterium terrae]MBB5015310.1 ribosomal protein S18 acetylase RimI-like enzyme [Rehaibacterium terrae]
MPRAGDRTGGAAPFEGLPSIRRARTAEAALLSRFMAHAFLDAFGHGSRQEDVLAHVRHHFSAARQSRELTDPACVTLVIGPPGDYAGYAQLVFGQPAPEALQAQAPVEMRRFYLRRDLHGRGWAASLMEAAKATARERGADALWLSVWQQAPRAIRFYRKHGFETIGTAVFHVGTDPQKDWLMACRLPAGG